MAQADFFLALDGIPGESQDPTFPDAIEVVSWTWGVAQKTTSAAGGSSGAGRVIVEDFTIHKRLDKASAMLVLACCTGKPIPKATLSARKAGGGQEVYWTHEFTNVLISGVQLATEGALVREVVKINFGKFNASYRQQMPSGLLLGPVQAGFDVSGNVKI
jgi:type VI secretion system secreted protein Hcp